MEFKNVTSISSPYGEVIKIQETVSGRVLWEKKKAEPEPVIEAGYPKIIVTIKKTGTGKIYYFGNVASLTPYEGAWATNDLAAEKIMYTRASVGDILTAYYVNNSGELSDFPNNAHLVNDAVWTLGPEIYLELLKQPGDTISGAFFTYFTMPQFISFSSYSGASISISSLVSDFSNYLAVFKAEIDLRYTGSKHFSYMLGSTNLALSSSSLGINISGNESLVYAFLVANT